MLSIQTHSATALEDLKSSKPERRLSKRLRGAMASCESSGGTSGLVGSCRFAMAPSAPASWSSRFNAKTYVDRGDPCGGTPRGRRQWESSRRIWRLDIHEEADQGEYLSR